MTKDVETYYYCYVSIKTMKRVSRSFETPQREDHLLRDPCVEGFEPALEFRMRRHVTREMRRRVGVNERERRMRTFLCIN